MGTQLVMGSATTNTNDEPPDHANKLVVATDDTVSICVLQADGFLDSTTYLPLRDAIIKAALDHPRGVIVDVSSLVVPVPSAWAVFTSARWHVRQWPDVPVALVCAHREGRHAIARNGVARFVPVYPSVQDAVAATRQPETTAIRRRARVELPHETASLSRSREFTARWLTAWSRPELIAVAKLVVTVLVENVLVHTGSAPKVRLECKGELVTVAVEDRNPSPATRRERSRQGGDNVSGLAIVAAMCRAWGSLPGPSGKTVWVSIGPENRL